VRRLVRRIGRSRPVRAYRRFGVARGGLLAGGIAYAAFFSIFPALAAGFTVFGIVLGNDTALQAKVVSSVNDSFGTALIAPHEGEPGVVSIDRLTGPSTLSIAAVISILLLLWTGLGWLEATREGIRAMFGQPPLAGNVVKAKGRDLSVLMVIGGAVLVSTGAGVAVSAAGGVLLRWVGLEGSTTGALLLGVLSTLVLLAVDVAVLLVLFRLLSGIQLPRRDLADGALAGGVALGVLKLFAGFLLQHVSDNKFLAAFAVAVGLLVWLNFVARIILLAASWAAITAVDHRHPGVPAIVTLTPDALQTANRVFPSGVGGLSGPGTVHPVRRMPDPVVSPRAADRVSVAAGAVLGAAGVVAARAAAGAVRTAVSAVLRRDDD
jgi:membrane protein